MLTALIVFMTMLVSSLMSSMSGGGASLITVPVLLSLGYSFPFAIAVVSVNASFWVPIAAINYLDHRKIEWPFVIASSIIGLIGCYIGVSLLVSIDQHLLEILAGTVILVLVAYTFFERKMGLVAHPDPSVWHRAASYPIVAVMGIYEALFGAGNGIAFTIMTLTTRGYDFIDGLGTYYLASLPWDIFVAYLLIQRGYVDLPLMALSVAGSLIGGLVGSRFAHHEGNRFIRIVFMGVGAVLGLKLLLGI